MSKVYSFTVMGRGDFPFDMLRYDQCWPVTGDDAAKIANFNTSTEVREITFNSLKRPTADRWSSFLWGCKENQEEA